MKKGGSCDLAGAKTIKKLFCFYVSSLVVLSNTIKEQECGHFLS